MNCYDNCIKNPKNPFIKDNKCKFYCHSNNCMYFEENPNGHIVYKTIIVNASLYGFEGLKVNDIKETINYGEVEILKIYSIDIDLPKNRIYAKVFVAMQSVYADKLKNIKLVIK